MKRPFYKELLESLNVWGCILLIFAFAAFVDLCIVLPVCLGVAFSWKYYLLYLISIPLIVFLLRWAFKEEDSENE